MSWRTIFVGPCPPAWAQVSSVTTTTGTGVDFILEARDQYPMIACETLPTIAVSIFTGGTP